MRFRSLTVTRTFAFLTIVVVAISGLALLPITGNCQQENDIEIRGWTSSNGNTANSYGATKQGTRISEDGTQEPTGDSWNFTANVNAKGVTASADPSSHNISHFEANKKYTGFGYVLASRSDYFWYHHWAHEWFFGNFPGIGCSNWDSSDNGYGCLGHTDAGDTDTNNPAHRLYNNEHTALTLDIQVAQTTYVDATIKYIASGNRRVVQLEVGDDNAKIGAKWQHDNKEAETVSLSKSYVVRTPAVAQDVGVSARVGFDSRTSSSAHVRFSFAGISDSAGLSYDPNSP